ncbi:flagellar export chaperone FliS [Pseudoduganella sp. GCM10020061]|uniref:flagellar export chaperone FliS n=1 Tax=Pseudoduganella sp. GCM10020061 TaxID=3317345 RepID=UPI0036358FE3
MFGSPNKGANAYAKVGLETGVVASSPHKLIVMLFEGAIVALRAGATHMAAGEIEKKGLSISKAINIIDNGLRASLDKKAGEVAQNLDSLYEYMSRRLIEANLKNDRAMLDEVIGLLADLKGAWDAIGDGAAAPAPVQAAPVAAAPQRMMAFDNLAPRRASLVSAG